MGSDHDHYEAHYADKLWALLPAIYRAEDTDNFDRPGPLREMVNRIGAQAAILRRSIDRLWEDQSIETCDDWVISYIGDLLATQLVSSLDARGQRLDVAKTIYYRRRKGTVAILEEIAADITGWDTRVVEFFRRLSRTRHNFDPEIGQPSDTADPISGYTLQLAQGLVGSLTYTPMGGWADLRNVYGAEKARSAFDEFFYTADVRRGKAQAGWHNIPRFGVFLWRLKSFGVSQTTPVPVQNCPGHYTFDPTGRAFDPKQQPTGLFAAASRAFGDQWVSPTEGQLPTPISQTLLETDLTAIFQHLYAAIDPIDNITILPNALGVYRKPGNFYELVPASVLTPEIPRPEPEVSLDPERGRLKILNPQPNDQFYVTYHYGFSSALGAGPYDRRILGTAATPTPEPISSVVGGGNELVAPLANLAPMGTIRLDDSLTYTAISDVGSLVETIQTVTLLAQNKARPVIRLPAPAPNVTEWAFTGDQDSTLVLEGLWISGGDLVLRGDFKSITLTCCTLDPGNVGIAPAPYAIAVDGRELIPCRLWIEGQIAQLNIDRCVLGSIRSRSGGAVEVLQATNSILQALGTDPAIALESGEVRLQRSTLLGPAQVHRLEASECILNDVVQVENTQQGCVRFSAWSTGSMLPQRYESVEISPKAPLFTSRDFGQPGFAQLLASVDNAILSGPPDATLSAGAEGGSEMGVFAREKNSIKERSLLLKYEEYMPLGLSPVLIHVT